MSVRSPTAAQGRSLPAEQKSTSSDKRGAAGGRRHIALHPRDHRGVRSPYRDNMVSTARYTVWNFVPKNLFEQLSELQNFYFFCIGILQIIPAITTSNSFPNQYIPLGFILFVSGLRAAIEDHGRHVNDRREGSRPFAVFRGLDSEHGVGDDYVATDAGAQPVGVQSLHVASFSAATVSMEDEHAAGVGARKPRKAHSTSRAARTAKVTPVDVVGKQPAHQRHSSNAPVEAGFEVIEAWQIHVGDIVCVRNDSPVPADLVLLRSSNTRGHCFVETSSLDGETDLKPKVAVSVTHAAYTNAEQLDKIDGEVICEPPNKKLDQFRGRLRSPLSDDDTNLTAENLLLRGTVLKNTDFVYGVAVYTGEDTKIRCNVQQGRFLIKRSSIMKVVDRGILNMLMLQVGICLLAAILAGVWHKDNQGDSWYLQLTGGAAEEGTVRFFTWFIIMSQLVPISLVVSSEIVKTVQAFFINRDIFLDHVSTHHNVVRSSQLNEDLGQVQFIFTDKTGTLTQNRMEMRVALISGRSFGSNETEISKRVAARKAQLHSGAPQERPTWTELTEHLHHQRRQSMTDTVVRFDAADELARVLWPNGADSAAGPSHRTSAATTTTSGTHLTMSSNVMSVNSYASSAGNSSTNHLEELREEKQGPPRAHSNGTDWSSTAPLEDQPLSAQTRRYLTHMALSNTITPVWDDVSKSYILQSSSPDELALAQFGQHMGFHLVGRNPTRLQIWPSREPNGVVLKEEYKHLGTLGFNSKRKRVTMIYERDGRVHLMCKGADSAILPLLNSATDPRTLQKLGTDLIKLAQNGLRTLVLAYADLPRSWWNQWKAKYEEAIQLPEVGNEESHQKGACLDACKICGCFKSMEASAGLHLLGATAIEDQLQALVPEAIQDFLAAGMKVWMLTGDKRETAKNIGLACNLIDPDMEVQPPGRSRLVEISGSWCRMLDTEEELKAMFSAFDVDDDGKVSLADFESAMGTMALNLEADGQDEIRRLFAAADTDQNGFIDFAEFAALMRASNLSMAEAVQGEIEHGLKLVKTTDPSLPVSMVVEGHAFSVLYPAEAVDSDAKDKSVRIQKRRAEQRRASTTALKAPARQSRSFSATELQVMRDKFFALAAQMKSVVCCRLTPFQKAKMVEEIQKRRGVVALAVGDGANDEAMIRRADIGVGIAGLEGTAASRASDFALGEFRLLHTLLFVHGHWSYRRIAELVLYIFYKAILVVAVMFWFGFFSGFSGQQFINDFILTFYNVLFTAAPILVLAVFDQPLDRSLLENVPAAYRSLLGAVRGRGLYFNEPLLYEWIARAFVHALIMYMLLHFTVGVSTSVFSDGKSVGLWFMSTLAYSGVVVLATLRILLEFSSVTWIHSFFVALSFFGYYGVLLLITLPATFNADMFGVVPQLYVSPMAWMVQVLIVAVPLLLDFIVIAVRREFAPTFVEVLQEYVKLRAGRGVDRLLEVARNLGAQVHVVKPKDKAPRAAHVDAPLMADHDTTPPSNNNVAVAVHPPAPARLASTQHMSIVMQHIMRSKQNSTGSNFSQCGSVTSFLVTDS